MEYGHVIRTERLKQGMKQIVLAKGICAPSYLSRIEQGLTVPSEDIIILLLEKLGIDYNGLKKIESKDEIIRFEKNLREIYKDILINRNKEFIKQKVKELEKEDGIFKDTSLYYTYLLVLLRFRLMLGVNFHEMEKDLEVLSKLKSNFNAQHYYLFKVNEALYYYLTNKTRKSMNSFESVISILDQVVLEDWEKADLNYMIGLNYIAENRIVISIDYISKALNYYKSNFFMNRVLDCYMLIGITYKKSDQFQDALDFYLKAKKICEKFNMQNRLGIVYHNLASLYIAMGENEKGISLLQERLENKSDRKGQLVSIFSMILEYSKMNDSSSVIDWCNRGLTLYSQLKDENQTMYDYHFKFYESLHQKQGLSEDIAIQTIEYFTKLQDYRHACKYSLVLAEKYFDMGRYKLSSIYFKKAKKYSFMEKNILKWEDL